MKFRIPFTLSSVEKLKKKRIFPQVKFFLKNKKKSALDTQLKNAAINVTTEQYLNIILRSVIKISCMALILSSIFFVVLDISQWFIWSFIVAILIGGFIFFSQRIYPKIYVNRREKDIEKNLIPALQDISIQLNSGVPIFSILVSIAETNYGELSKEFEKAVKRINSGFPEEEVLGELGDNNSSIFFKRTLWQISNGMKAGSDLYITIKESIKILNGEQLIQIQRYGNKLNPLVMFYMLITVVLPALSITFITVVASLVSLPAGTTISLYVGLFIMVAIIQIMFLGIIKSARPSLA